MIPFAAFALGSSLVAVAASGVPTLNVEPSCKAAAESGMSVGMGRTTQTCLDDEKTARETLVKSWSAFGADDKSHCLSLISTGGGPSYVELLSCLEMSRDAKKIAKGENPNESQPAKARSRRTGQQ